MLAEPLKNLDFGKNGVRSFESGAAFKKFVSEEYKSWHWISNVQLPGSETAGREFFDDNIVPLKNLADAFSAIESPEQQQIFIDKVTSHYKKRNLPFSSGPIGNLILDTAKTDHGAAFTILLLSQDKTHKAISTAHGVLKFLIYQQGSETTKSAVTKALERLVQEVADTSSDARAKFVTLTNENAKIVSDFRGTTDQFVAQSGDIIATSKKKIRELEQLYEEKLQLSASVTYWTRRGHWYLAGAILATISLVLAFAGLSWIMYEEVVTFVIPKIQTATGQTTVLPFLPTPTLTILGITLMLGILFLRTNARIMLSFYHLLAVCRERATIAKMYHALLKEAALPEEAKLHVFDALLRPAQTGFIGTDEKLPAIADSLTNALKKNA